MIQHRLENLTSEQAERIEVLVPKELVDTLQKTTKFEVLVFYTRFEYETTNNEKEFKKKIFAKFRDYCHAEKYAQELAMDNVYYYKITLRA